MKRNIRIEVTDEKESDQEFVAAWRKSEKGGIPGQTVERLYFKDRKTLLRFLTPRRLEALKVVHEQETLNHDARFCSAWACIQRPAQLFPDAYRNEQG